MRLFLFILLLGCVPEEIVVLYKISKGSHYSTPLLSTTLDRNPLVFYAKFDSTAIYNGDGDINKLYGFSDANSSIHENSARFGWRWNNGLEIFTYSYCDGDRSFVKIGEATIGKWQRYEIRLRNDGYDYVFLNNKLTSKRCTKGKGIYTISQPYFGGDKPAPHNIYIAIKQ